MQWVLIAIWETKGSKNHSGTKVPLVTPHHTELQDIQKGTSERMIYR